MTSLLALSSDSFNCYVKGITQVRTRVFVLVGYLQRLKSIFSRLFVQVIPNESSISLLFNAIWWLLMSFQIFKIICELKWAIIQQWI